MSGIAISHARLTVLLFIATGLAACGDRNPEPDDFAAACNANGNLSAEVCVCLDAQAQQLSPETHAFVIAKIAEDEETALRLRENLDDNQEFEAGQFISRGIQVCLIDLPNTIEE